MAVPGYVLKNKRTTLERAEKFISDIYFTDINLKGRLYSKRSKLERITHYAAPGRISYEDAVKGEYKETSIGQEFGPTWATHWFKIEIEIPESWIDEEVHFVWNSQSEAMIWKDGKPCQGLNSDNGRTDFTLTKKASLNNLRLDFYVEMACNKLFGAGIGSEIGPVDPNRKFGLNKAEIAVINPSVEQLLNDFQVIIELIQCLPEDSNRGYQALYIVNEMVNLCDVNDPATFEKVHDLANKFFSEKNGDSQHTVYAVGNCHIDSELQSEPTKPGLKSSSQLLYNEEINY